jgi:hypothetical protein
MCEYTEELYSRWVSRKLTRIEQAFFEEHMQNCTDCSTLVLEENKERLSALRVSSLKFGFGIGLFASLITSIGVVIGLNNIANYASRDFIISGILYLPIALFTGVQIVAFKLSEAVKTNLSSLLRSIVTLFVFSLLLYSVLFNIPVLAKASYANIGKFNESLVLFFNIVLSAFYWVIGNRLAIQAYNRELETSSFLASLLSTWVLVIAGVSYLALR